MSGNLLGLRFSALRPPMIGLVDRVHRCVGCSPRPLPWLSFCAHALYQPPVPAPAPAPQFGYISYRKKNSKKDNLLRIRWDRSAIGNKVGSTATSFALILVYCKWNRRSAPDEPGGVWRSASLQHQTKRAGVTTWRGAG